jgi:hypothetical protein
MITSSDVQREIDGYLDRCGEWVAPEKLWEMTEAFIQLFGRVKIDSVSDAAWSEFLQDHL